MNEMYFTFDAQEYLWEFFLWLLAPIGLIFILAMFIDED